MSVVKSVNSRSNTKAALKNTLKYVLNEAKTTTETTVLTYVIGDYPHLEVTPDQVYMHFMDTKKLWGKEDGRMYKHFVISWHKDENITPEQTLEFGKEWAEKMFPDFCSVVAAHTDRDHCHCHIVVNSVSMVDGHKLHMDPQDLQACKDYNDELCERYGFSITEKGKHYDGTELEEGTIISYKKDTYNLLTKNKKQAHLADIATAILDVLSYAESIAEFCSELLDEYNIKVNGNWNRKYVTFESLKDGTVVRNKNLSKTFNIDLSKEAIENAITRNKVLSEQHASGETTDEFRIREMEEKIRESCEETERINSNYPSTAGTNPIAVEEFRKRTAADRVLRAEDEYLAGAGERIDRATERLGKSEQRYGGLIEGCQAIIGKLTKGIEKLRDIPRLMETEAVQEEAKEAAKEMLEYRGRIIYSHHTLRTSLLPNLSRDSYFREKAEEEYQSIQESLYYYMKAYASLSLPAQILARNYDSQHKTEREAEVFSNIKSFQFDELSRDEKVFAECCKATETMLADPMKAYEDIMAEHKLEPVVEYSRGPRRPRR